MVSKSCAESRPIRGQVTDRKSTRLNSSHLVISYAVFCLKKKKNHVSYPLRPTTEPSRDPSPVLLVLVRCVSCLHVLVDTAPDRQRVDPVTRCGLSLELSL